MPNQAWRTVNRSSGGKRARERKRREDCIPYYIDIWPFDAVLGFNQFDSNSPKAVHVQEHDSCQSSISQSRLLSIRILPCIYGIYFYCTIYIRIHQDTGYAALPGHRRGKRDVSQRGLSEYPSFRVFLYQVHRYGAMKVDSGS